MAMILATWKDETRRTVVRGSLGKKFVRPHFNKKELGVMAHACHPMLHRRLRSGGLQAKSETLSPK
jgi:hypothetical protein